MILDIERPDHPRIDQVFNAGGCINDVKDVKLGITYVSEFAYLADGKNGLRVVQLTSPETPGNDGFSPRPTPELIATFKIPKGGEALAISKGLDRDRAVDESGHQISVFGRVGARPFNLQQQRKLYLARRSPRPLVGQRRPPGPRLRPRRIRPLIAIYQCESVRVFEVPRLGIRSFSSFFIPWGCKPASSLIWPGLGRLERRLLRRTAPGAHPRSRGSGRRGGSSLSPSSSFLRMGVDPGLNLGIFGPASSI